MSTIPNMKPFDTLIRGLKTREIGAIEYGNPQAPGGYGSLLRIRYIATNAGMQYCIKFVSLGMEGSGDYYPSTPQGIQDLRDHLICYIDRHNQKSERLSKRTKMLMNHTTTFFGVSK